MINRALVLESWNNFKSKIKKIEEEMQVFREWKNSIPSEPVVEEVDDTNYNLNLVKSKLVDTEILLNEEKSIEVAKILVKNAIHLVFEHIDPLFEENVCFKCCKKESDCKRFGCHPSSNSDGPTIDEVD